MFSLTWPCVQSLLRQLRSHKPLQFSSVTQLWLTVQLHGLQHTRLLCSSLFPRVCSNSRRLSQLCHPTISSSVTLFCPQSFPASGSFPVSQLFRSGDQTIGASAPASVLPMNIQGWFPLGLTGFFAFQETLKSLLQHHSSKASILWHSAFFMVQLYTWLLGKIIG